MHGHSGNRIIFVVQTSLVVLCLTGVGIGQDSSFFNSNSQILKAFQDEMKTLEAAAHRVNSLFLNHASPGQPSSPEHQNPRDEQNGDNKNEPTNKDLEVTVLANPEILKNSQNQEEKFVKDSVTSAPEDKQKQPQQSGAESSFSPFGSFFNNYFYRQEPWWKGSHVCVDRAEKIIQKENGKDIVHPESGFLIMGTGTFERCKQTSGKYVCTTVTNTPQESKTVTVTYQCCEGYHKQGRSCIEGEDSLEKNKAIDDNSRGRNSISSSSSSDNSMSSSISHEADDKINMGNNYEKTVMRSPYVPVKVAVIKSKNYPKQEDQRLTQDKQNQARTHENVDTSYSSSSNEDGHPSWFQDINIVSDWAKKK